jgi:hypothetical protein
MLASNDQSAIESAEFCVDFAQGCNLLTINVVAPVERIAGTPRVGWVGEALDA